MESSQTGRVIDVCISEKKGTRKKPVGKAYLREEYGVEGDAHAGRFSRRQISLLGIESIEKIKKYGFNLKPGDFAENITTEGIELYNLPIGTILNIGKQVQVEVTQIGKKCHSDCEISRLIGQCIMPREGIFARVLKSGWVKSGDPIIVVKKG